MFAPGHGIVHAALAHAHRLMCSSSDDGDAQSAARLLHDLAVHVCLPLHARCDGALRQLRDEKLLAKWKVALDAACSDAASLSTAALRRQRHVGVSAAYRCSESFAQLVRLEHECVARLLWRHLTDEELTAVRDAHIAAAHPQLESSVAWMAGKDGDNRPVLHVHDVCAGHPVVYPQSMLDDLKLVVPPPSPPAVIVEPVIVAAAAPPAVVPVPAAAPVTRARRKSSADYVLHLIVSYACPWSARALLARSLCGLDRLVSVSVLCPQKDAGEWVFDSAGRFQGCDAHDTLFDSCTSLADVYRITQPPQWNGRATAPMLIDRKLRACVSNFSLDIVRILGALGGATKLNLRPDSLGKRIDPVVANITAGQCICVCAL